MRTLLIATVALAGSFAVTAAQAQAPVSHGWNGGRWNNGATWNGPRGRWGERIGGRWWGGMRAPGGWAAYRRPVRGWVLPRYWIAPTWYVNDWSSYGLPQPPQGYAWSRYYDDAVLIDGRGSVYDSVGGVAWDRDDAGYAYDDRGYGAAYADGAPQLAYPQFPYETRDADNGLGGAAIGAVVGGVAGNVIAGRGNRLGGTLLGAGAGALAGMAIDRSDRAGRVPVAPPPAYGAGYAPPPAYSAGYAPPPAYGAGYAPPPPYRAGGAPVVAYQQGSYGGDYAGTTYSGTTYYGPAPQVAPAPIARPYGYGAPSTIYGADGTVVTTSTTQGSAGYVAGGWYYPGTTVTTVTVQSGSSAGTEVIEEEAVAYKGGYRGRRFTKGGCRC
ncbi:RcnB family protein [uncultured Sphingomonas sp.]|uniref:RcnB family protein n=1 Tax=uncultured Sphingomonas sp. TaxID=158754 RepID=UPI0025EE2E00|nr:RcnB family protein [uncultured Sphingomonas sp.]